MDLLVSLEKCIHDQSDFVQINSCPILSVFNDIGITTDDLFGQNGELDKLYEKKSV